MVSKVNQDVDGETNQVTTMQVFNGRSTHGVETTFPRLVL